MIVCRDKIHLDLNNVIRKIEKSLEQDIYCNYREWPYKNVPRKIIVEEFLENADGTDINDYKFFCFNGEPKFLKVDFNRFIEHHANYYDLNWNMLPFGEVGLEPQLDYTINKPKNFESMISIARKLSSVAPFVRVDLYNVDGKIYFSELTFYPASGMGKFTPHGWDLEIGNMLKLPY